MIVSAVTYVTLGLLGALVDGAAGTMWGAAIATWLSAVVFWWELRKGLLDYGDLPLLAVLRSRRASGQPT